MRLLFTLALTLATLIAPVYAHYRLSGLAPSATQRWLLRVALVLIGLGFGWAMSSVYMDVEEGAAVTAFIMGFGFAHLPPAVVLWLKHHREKQRQDEHHDQSR